MKTNKEYLQSYGRCPKCDSSEIEGGSISIDCNSAWQEIVCQSCTAEWTDYYLLSHFVLTFNPGEQGELPLEERNQCKNSQESST